MKPIEQYNSIVKKNGGKSFFDIEHEHSQDRNYMESLSHAKYHATKRAQEIEKAAADPTHPNHEASLAMARKHPGKVRQACIDEANAVLGISEPEYRNESLEKNCGDHYHLIDGGTKRKVKYVQNTKKDTEIMDEFKKRLSARFNAQGYKGVHEDIKSYFLENPLSMHTTVPKPEGSEIDLN